MKLLTFLASIVLLLSACDQVSNSKGEHLMTLTTAPNFTLLDQDSKSHQLADYSAQYVLIYFYPKDDTPGCTKEACMIRDSYSGFQERNIQVFGISADNPESHKKFIEKYHLPFTLLSDEKKEVAKLYNTDGIFLKRISYLIAPGGKVVGFYPNVDPANHAAEILADFDKVR
jgi:peroxiredoxin Q/BCP